MTNSKTTKRALFSSVVALLLCFTMLLGTTFAWFTDSAVSGSNVITAGNLDIVVEYTLDGETWNNLDGAEDLFQKGLWEPGHTEVVALRITNNGSLALKYAANMNIVNEEIGKTKDEKDIKLSDILTVSTGIYGVTNEVDPFLGYNISEKTLELAFADESSVVLQNTATFAQGNVLGNDQKLMPEETHYLIVRVDMDENVGNEANHNGVNVPTINFGINVLATQYTYENDSFGNQYDKDATYPEIIPTVKTVEEFINAVEAGGEVVLGADLEIPASYYAQDGGWDPMFYITKDTTIDLNGYNINIGKYTGSGYSTIFRVDNATLTVKGEGDVVIERGTWITGRNNAVVNIEGGNWVATNYEPDGDAIMMYHYSKLNISGGTFKSAYYNIVNYQYDHHDYQAQISGGSFANWNPANTYDYLDINNKDLGTTMLADGYKAVSEVVDGVTWYTVVAE